MLSKVPQEISKLGQIASGCESMIRIPRKLLCSGAKAAGWCACKEVLNKPKYHSMLVHNQLQSLSQISPLPWLQFVETGRVHFSMDKYQKVGESRLLLLLR
jgi:hypothetical protein